MKNHLIFIVLLALLLFNCEEEKKNEPAVIDQPKVEIEEDSIIESDIDSVEVPAIVKKPVTKKPVVKETEVKKPIAAPPKPKNQEILITPINHATMILESANATFYIDPVGGKEVFAAQRPPTFILITDIHGDHFDIETIKAIKAPNTIIIGPRAVRDKLPKELIKNFTLIFNGLSRSFNTSKMNVTIDGVAMYNLRKEALQYHEKGRGNGYVITLNKKRIYISGDTEDILEMRQLKNIDIAFVCMNLPYTMTVESAADAVLQFKPKKVYPYHYRGSDVNKFKRIVNNANPGIDVIILDWYKPSA